MKWQAKPLTVSQRKYRLRGRILGMLRYAPMHQAEYRDAFHGFLNQLGGLAGEW